MNIAEEIRNKFASLTTNHAILLESSGGEFPSWAIKFNDAYATAIEVEEGIKINESFANVSYFTDYFTIEGISKHLLILSSSEIRLRNEFAGVCAIFLELGDDNSKRTAIQKDPLEWWINWKELIGNKSVDSTVHGILGELITLYWMKRDLAEDITASNWTGPDGKSTDIVTSTKKAEVKTSLIKYNNIVTISSQFQLETVSSMSLIYIKLEEIGELAPGVNIVSIDKIVKILSEEGLDENELNKKINKMGLKQNSMDRKRNYRVLEMNEYPVNEKFPLLTKESFKDNFDKERLLQLTYKIELAGLESNKIILTID
ncbi:PD-(D/E)XK motif protein [Gracilibacillus oryzae]|uniref:PD-(D/E)XK motif protein n=1 Tax=Gracilibacillus oryzae TaxID=1672701 RepID=A0A7C8KNZ8_9BACI|nr:PD-(D/E)XK motif protein [Gracilibacillus oryzae]KAB8125584.1 PD-(D/E)XK motif protein [Gracilibacillus oryzae]